MKTYIATSLARVADQQDLAFRLRVEFDIDLTFDWTREGTLAGNPHPEVAQKELQGVKDADFVCCLLPAKFGTHVELGIALAMGKRVFLFAANEAALYCGNDYKCVFYEHPLVTTVLSTDMTDLIKEIAIWLRDRHELENFIIPLGA